MNKTITLLAISSLVLSGCGGGGGGSSSDSKPAAQTGEVKYDLSQAFKDYYQASAILNLGQVGESVIHPANYRLLMDSQDQVIDYSLSAEPSNSASKCQLAPFTPSLKAKTNYADDNAMTLEKLGNQPLFLMNIEGIPAKYSESTCQYVDVNRSSNESTSKNVLALANQAGVVKELDFTIEKILARGDLANNLSDYTLAISTTGDVYQLGLNSANGEPEVKKVASTGSTRWQQATSDYLVSDVKDYNIKLYSLKDNKEYNFVAKENVESLAIANSTLANSEFIYTKYYSSTKLFILEIDSSTDQLINTREVPAALIDPITTTDYSVNDNTCQVTFGGTTETIYDDSDASYFNGNLATKDIADFFICQSDNRKTLAVRQVNKSTGDSKNYNLFTFTSDKVITFDKALVAANNAVYVSAGEGYLGASNYEAYKLDSANNQPVLLSNLSNVPSGMVITHVDSIAK